MRQTPLLFLMLLAVRASALPEPEVAVPAARVMTPWIDLSGRTRPVVVLHPKQDAYARAALAVCTAIEAQGGAKPAATSDPEAALPEHFNVIALGNVNNNELIARLYWNRYAYADSLLPGVGAHTVRTVHDPYPWHGKGDVVVVGVSESAALGQAVEALTGELRTGVTPLGLDHVLVVSSAKPLAEPEERKLKARREPSFHTFLESAEHYLRTGQREYARHAIATLARIAALYAAKPEHDCDWPEEINSGAILATWDAFEECPLLTPEQRTRYTHCFLRFLRALQKHVSAYSSLGTDDLVVYNHTTYPLLGLYFGSRYFKSYYRLPEVDIHLSKAHACFRAQAQSYKPSEDSDAYLILTVGHAIDYCLAEWRTDLLDAGLIRNHADYYIGICDSALLPSGFGDSGRGSHPGKLRHVLPRAFWWTRDPGYLWVLRHALGDTWANPFHRDITPVEPTEHLGVRVFPLDPQVYKRTQLRSYYNEPLSPPNVPLAAAFDKIAFRESWNKKAQYLLLDGFARGNHLHYDGNAIIEFVDRGRRWLWDHDYLTRNTTEHNMLSVIRDARALELVPSCAGLICAADLGGRVGLTSTEMKGYAGIDWRRDIIWRKGDYFVVLDAMTARNAGRYDLDLAWKLEDRGNERIVTDGNTRWFVARRYPVQSETKHITIVDDPEASGGRAVLLGQNASVLTFAVDLSAGTYGIVVTAYGVDSSSDSLFASTNGSERVVCHVPQQRYGAANTKYDLSGNTPQVAFVGNGSQLLALSMREYPPVRVDRIALLPLDGGAPTVIEAESATTPDPSLLERLDADRFCIKWPDPLNARTVATTPAGIAVPVRKLIQRISAQLDAGARAETANLLYTDSTRTPAVRGLRRLCPGAVLVTGDEAALIARPGADVPGLSFDAQMLYLSPHRMVWADGCRVTLGDAHIATPAVCDLELDLSSGETLPRGQEVSAAIDAETVTRWLTSLTASNLSARQETGSERPAGLQPLWTWRSDTDGGLKRMRLRDIDRDGSPEILVAAGQQVTVLSSTGKPRWSYHVGGLCHDVDAGELTASAGLETVAASDDTCAHMLNAAGELISTQQMRGPAWNQNFGNKPWACVVALVRDLDNDGVDEIVVGALNFDLRIYDAAWQQLGLARRAVVHGSVGIHAVDVDGDGNLEILVPDRYGSVHLYGSDARARGTFYTSIGDMQVAAGDLDGDGRTEVVGGSSTGDMACHRMTEDGMLPGRPSLWRFDNYGYGANRLRLADVDDDGRREVVVASQTGYLYVLAHDGSVEWSDRAGSDIVEAVVLEHSPSRLAYFDRDGVMTLASGDGRRRRRFDLKMTVAHAVQMGDTLVVGGQDRIACFSATALTP